MEQKTGVIIPKEIIKKADDLFGKKPEKLTSKQLNAVMLDTQKALIDPQGELVQKIGRYGQGVDKDSMDIRMAMKYGGYNKGIFTDTCILISDTKIAKENYEKMWLDDTTKEVKKLIKNGAETPFDKLVENLMQVKRDSIKDNEHDFPDFRFITDTIHEKKVYLKGYYADNEYFSNVVLTTGVRFIVLNANKFAFMKKQFPDAEMRTSNTDIVIPLVQFIQDDKVVGAISPINIENKDIPYELTN